jgi:Protein of unknown function (DUF1593)
MIFRAQLLHLWLAAAFCVIAACASTPAVDPKPRLFVLTDIGNEPDDAESFVRLLLYANELDLEGLAATTSVWQPDRVQPQLLRERIDAYGVVLPNLRQHAGGYPEPDGLHALVLSGSAALGMAGVGDGKATEASRALIAAADRSDMRPLHISIWGGAADLAQALWDVRSARSADEVAAFTAKLRVYSISDQDDAGPWVRENFPDLHWVASRHAFDRYDTATWKGISMDIEREEKWPAFEMVTNDWLEDNIRRGALGALYPPHQYIMEGDTPAFLGLVPNGLNMADRIDWGGWGGRYQPIDDSALQFGDTVDTFTDETGKVWSSNYATVFRWRRAFQNDFAARIAWTLTPSFEDANHTPQLVLNGESGTHPVEIRARAGRSVKLSANGSSDPDGNGLAYRWWHYPEPTGAADTVLVIENADTPAARFIAPEVTAITPYHIILEVTDNGLPPLTAYRRAIVTVRP